MYVCIYIFVSSNTSGFTRRCNFLIKVTDTEPSPCLSSSLGDLKLSWTIYCMIFGEILETGFMGLGWGRLFLVLSVENHTHLEDS